MTEKKVWLIIGASRGVGVAIASALDKRQPVGSAK